MDFPLYEVSAQRGMLTLRQQIWRVRPSLSPRGSSLARSREHVELPKKLPTTAAVDTASTFRSPVVSLIMSRPPERLRPVNRPNRHRPLLSPRWFLIALVGLIASTAVSRNAAHGTETRVRAIDTPAAITVGAETNETPASIGHLRLPQPDSVSATGVAT